MQENFMDMEQELLKVILHPKKLEYYKEKYNYDLEDMYD